jgi:hypothetical protein
MLQVKGLHVLSIQVPGLGLCLNPKQPKGSEVSHHPSLFGGVLVLSLSNAGLS